MAYFHFFWSTDLNPQDPFHLQTGLSGDDLIKPFMSRSVDASFRNRQFSYLIEILTFKLGQFWGSVSFRDYSLIVIHLINTFLLWVVLARLGGDRYAALIGALLFLNSGIALSTLLFPIRNAKLLSIMLCLAAWVPLATADNRPAFLNNLPAKTFWFCGVLLFLALLTDENSFFFLAFFVLYLALRWGKEAWRNRRVAGMFIGVLALFFVTIGLFYQVSRHIDSGVQPEFQKYLSSFPEKLQNSRVVHDCLDAFTRFFLRRAFGYWDRSLAGAAAFVSFVGLLWLAARRPMRFPTLLSLGALGLIAVKAVLLPHYYGYHDYIMPVYPGKGGFWLPFPTMLYFSCYYSYFDLFLIVLALSVLLQQAFHKNPRRCLYALLFVTIINASNAIHWKEGVAGMIRYHRLFDMTNEAVIPKIQKIQDVLSQNPGRPVYVSFPSGSQPVFKRRYELIEEFIQKGDPLAYKFGLNPKFYNYATILPVKYLRSIEEGRVIISLQNAGPLALSENELSAAGLFYDVEKEVLLDLDQLKRKKAGEKRRLVFFVKGGAQITLKAGDSSVTVQQDYGYSYQMFDIPLSSLDFAAKDIQWQISPLSEAFTVDLVGPFEF